MKLYRTCAPKTANIEHFLDSLEEIQAVQKLMPTQSMLDEVFSRRPSNNSSRFCPPEFAPIPIYVSESAVTTFYEYCFHLLSNKKFIPGNKPVNATLYFLKLKGSPKIIKDISKKPPHGVMSKTSYGKAHAFIRKLTPFPNLIKYCSVRDKLGNINYAIYEKRFLETTGVDPTQIIVSFVDANTVEVTQGTTIQQISPAF